MRGAPEILSWRSTDPVADDQEDDERPIGDWVDLGDLGDSGDLGADPLGGSTAGCGAFRAAAVRRVRPRSWCGPAW